MRKPLTPREKQVLSMLKQGHSLEYVGKMLGLTWSTVYSYRKSIYVKLGINEIKQAPQAEIKLEMTPTRDFIYNLKERTRTYLRWTADGIYCEESGQACWSCPVFKYYGLRPQNGCNQPESNQILKDKGIQKPKYGAWSMGNGIDIKTLRNSGWRYVSVGSHQDGYWVDPIHKKRYGTEEALQIQKEREQQ